MNYFYRRIPPSSSSPQLPWALVDSDLPQVGVELAGDTRLGQGEQGGLDTISVTGLAHCSCCFTWILRMMILRMMNLGRSLDRKALPFSR